MANMGIYTIYDLADAAGVSVRQVRGWVSLGVVPPALRKGKDPFVWTAEHMRIVKEVQEIREGNMTLADIRDRLHPEEDDE